MPDSDILTQADRLEHRRLDALDRYAILDTPTEPDFDDIARLAADTFDAPIAVVNLIARGRQWFKAEIGIGARELPLDVSICAHAILQREMMVVPDTRDDPRFACNPLVTADGGLRFYAGAQLTTPDGFVIGTMCVLDRAPRPGGITAHQRLTLEVLARQVMNQLELRRAIAASDALNETLDRRVAETVAERELALEALRQSQKLEAIGQLTGGVAHDFNNLLTVIRGSVDLLRRPDLPEDRRRRYVDAIGDTADRAARLTGQLLAFARRQALTPETFDSGESLIEVASMLRSLAGGRILLETALSEEPCFIRADRNQFDTAIVNMGLNARDAMNGEGRLSIATAPAGHIPATGADVAVAGDFVAISIGDTGAGIAPGDLLRVFEPFFTTKPVGEGTGLGLSQVIGFAKQSGGDVRVESVVGGGTTFTLYLPRAAGAGAPAATDDAGAPIAGAGICVLVVEDNEQVGAFATEALRELGYDSVLAPCATVALDELDRDRGRFHVVFSDVMMPGMSGLELGEAVRHRFPAVPVVLTSGYAQALAQNDAHGFELLQKPYSLDGLAQVFRKVLGPGRE